MCRANRVSRPSICYESTCFTQVSQGWELLRDGMGVTSYGVHFLEMCSQGDFRSESREDFCPSLGWAHPKLLASFATKGVESS